MQMRTQTMGHVALTTPATTAMEIQEEACETAMLRCRYSKKPGLKQPALLYGFSPTTNEIVYNPGTLQDLADMFQITLQHVFTH